MQNKDIHKAYSLWEHFSIQLQKWTTESCQGKEVDKPGNIAMTYENKFQRRIFVYLHTISLMSVHLYFSAPQVLGQYVQSDSSRLHEGS